jgi:hypothetical protein
VDNVSIRFKDVPSMSTLHLHLVRKLIGVRGQQEGHAIWEHWKGDNHALDYICDSPNSVGAGIDH